LIGTLAGSIQSPLSAWAMAMRMSAGVGAKKVDYDPVTGALTDRGVAKQTSTAS